MKFSDLKIDAKILSALEDEGYESPSPIQEQAIPPALRGIDILGCAQTGTGKTAAFAIPTIQRLSSETPPQKEQGKIRALVLTPTRELALQIHESFLAYGKNMGLKSCVIMGGVKQNPQIDELRRGVDILIATPGRLLDLIYQGYVELSAIRIFILDEADRMLDMGFIDDVKRLIELIPEKKQTLFFTATMPPDVLKLTQRLLKDPVNVTVAPVSSTVDLTDQYVCYCDGADKLDLLAWIFQNAESLTSALVFTRTKHGADKLARKLKQVGVKSAAIHGDKTQSARQEALENFKLGKVKVLVATDIAARGIDIDDLSHVFNYDLPDDPETYVHRIGRTGRAGKTGTAIALCSNEERKSLEAIERLTKKPLIVVAETPYHKDFSRLPHPPKKQKQPRPPRNLSKNPPQTKR